LRLLSKSEHLFETTDFGLGDWSKIQKQRSLKSNFMAHVLNFFLADCFLLSSLNV